jgi:hypothetical protein
MQELNVVELIENNPIVKLSNTYNSKLLQKMKEQFSNFEQQLFISSFYCYLNCDKNIDFVIDLDNIWKWLGFCQKVKAVLLLEKHFKLDIDYINSTTLPLGKAVFKHEENIKQNGGQNIKKIFLTIKCFKSLCLKAQTKKASEIHEYYMKMEEILYETVEEETNELRLQLEQKDTIILDNVKYANKDKQKAIEQTIIIQFPVNTECIYFGTIDNTNEEEEKLIKFGHTNDLSTRTQDHHKNYTNFILVAAFRVQNKVEIENLIKTYPKIKRQIRSIEVNGKNKTEIIAYDSTNFTIDKLSKYIKDIIHSKTYSIDNYNKLIKSNEELENENRTLKEINNNQENIIAQKSIEINYLKEKIKQLEKHKETIASENQSVYSNILLPEDEINKKFNEFVNSICIVRPDVEELSVNIEGRYRLWNQVKPTKEMFHALKNYLDTRFKPKRVQGNHGYIGIKIKTVEYKKCLENSTVETFIFQVCQFSDCGKILNSTLLKEYQKWKLSVEKELSDNDLKELKEYLNNSPYALKSTVWTEEGSNEGYYGISLKINENIPKNIASSTGKKIYKRENNTNMLLGTWNSIAKAAESEGMCAAKMSRYVKNKTIANNSYYSTV